MELLFENKFNRSKKDYKESYVKILFSSFLLPLIILLIFMLIILSLVYPSDYGKGETFGIAFSLILYLIILLNNNIYKLPELSFNRDLEQNHGNSMLSIISFTDEKVIYDSSTNTHLEFPYHYIKSVKKTKNLFLIITKANMIYILRKDSFTKGSSEEFLTFIKSKISNK